MFFQVKLKFSLFKTYLNVKSSFDKNVVSGWQRFEIKNHKSNSQKYAQNRLWLIIHKRLVEALKVNTYAKEHLINELSYVKIPNSIVIDSEPYFIHFVEEYKIIRGTIFLENKIDSNESNVINMDCTIVDHYISNKNFRNTMATFNNAAINQDFCIIIQIAKLFTS